MTEEIDDVEFAKQFIADMRSGEVAVEAILGKYLNEVLNKGFKPVKWIIDIDTYRFLRTMMVSYDNEILGLPVAVKTTLSPSFWLAVNPPKMLALEFLSNYGLVGYHFHNMTDGSIRTHLDMGESR